MATEHPNLEKQASLCRSLCSLDVPLQWAEDNEVQRGGIEDQRSDMVKLERWQADSRNGGHP